MRIDVIGGVEARSVPELVEAETALPQVANRHTKVVADPVKV
jgi:hypothetical protein